MTDKLMNFSLPLCAYENAGKAIANLPQWLRTEWEEK